MDTQLISLVYIQRVNRKLLDMPRSLLCLRVSHSNVFATLFCISVELTVNKLTSERTLLPKDYYDLPFCRDDVVETKNQNLGQFLSGDSIKSSPYQINMMQDVYCQQLCISNLGSNDLGANAMTRAIRNNYHHNWLVDSLPAASKTEDDTTVTTRYWGGMPIGFIASDTNKAYIFNHMNFEIHYSDESDPDKAYIVRVIAQPFSIKHEFESSEYPFKINDPIRSCNDTSEMSWEEKFRSRRDHTRYEMLYPPIRGRDVETDPLPVEDLDGFDARNFGQIPQPASGKCTFVSFFMCMCDVRYEVSVIWLLHLNLVCLYLIAFANPMC